MDKPARAQLHELLQTISNVHNIKPSIVPTVEYEIVEDDATPSQKQHVCHLSLQLPTETAPRVFKGSAGKRKSAYEAAAALALEHLQCAAPQRPKVVLTHALLELLMPPKVRFWWGMLQWSWLVSGVPMLVMAVLL